MEQTDCLLAKLPEDLIFEILLFLRTSDILHVALLAKFFHRMSEKDSFWKKYTLQVAGILEDTPKQDGNWKNYFKELEVGWSWNDPMESQTPWLRILNDRKTTERYTSLGNNTAIQTTKPFNTKEQKYRKSFRISIDRMGGWFAVGVASSSFILENSSLVGVSGNCSFNVGYGLWGSVSDGSTMTTISTTAKLAKMKQGDNIRITLDMDEIDKPILIFYLNEEKVATAKFNDPTILETVPLYPTLSLSAFTTVSIMKLKA